MEICVGYGSNFPYYVSVNNLTLIEPDVIDRDDLRKKLEGITVKTTTLIERPFEKVQLAPSSFDGVVATLVFCSVKEGYQFLDAINKALKIGGTFFFLEHIKSKSLPRRLLQHLINPIWRAISGGCQCNRPTDVRLLSDSRFTVLSSDYFRTSAGFPWVKDHVIGVIKKK